MSKISASAKAFAVLLLIAGSLIAASAREGTDAITVPQVINYQGKLTNVSGDPVPDGSYGATFRLYSSTTLIWSEDQTVAVTGGLFNVLLGSVVPITSIPAAGDCSLEVVLGGSPMVPRIPLVSAPYTYNAQSADNADRLDGNHASAFALTGHTHTVNGDVTGTVPGSLAVVALRGRSVATTAPSNGQVLTWSGSNWAPATASTGVTSIAQGGGVTCSPNPITTTGSISVNAVFCDSHWVSNQTAAVQQPGAFWIYGTGRAQQFYGLSATAGAPAIRGDGATYGDGVFGQCNTSSYAGGRGLNSNSAGTGIAGGGNNATPVLLPGGSGGAFTGTSYGSFGRMTSTTLSGSGVLGTSSCSLGFGVSGANNHLRGTGVAGAGDSQSVRFLASGSGGAFTGSQVGCYATATVDSPGTGLIAVGNNQGAGYTTIDGSGGAFTGKSCGVFGYSTNTSGGGAGVLGTCNDYNGFGVYASNAYTVGTGLAGVGNNGSAGYLAGGSGGAFTGAATGSYSVGTNAGGTGVLGVGNNLGGGSVLVGGSGGAFTGDSIGVFGAARATDGLRAGGYFSAPGGASVYVGCVEADGTVRKIEGAGTVNTVMATRSGRRVLVCPEMPEAYFEDIGRAQLAAGHCRVDLEPLFSDCVTIDNQHPLTVFVQLEDDCRGVYVKTDATGFDVNELQGGRSDARFSYRIAAKWKGYENSRFAAALPVPRTVEPATRTFTPHAPVQVGAARTARAEDGRVSPVEPAPADK